MQEVALKERKGVFLVLTLVVCGTNAHKPVVRKVTVGDPANSWD